MTEEQVKLVADNEGLVYGALRRFEQNYDYEEILAAGRVGLIKAARTFDSSKGSFSTYAYMLIRSHGMKYVENGDLIRTPQRWDWSAKVAVCSLDVVLGDAWTQRAVDLVADGRPLPCTCFDGRDRLRTIRSALKRLTKAQRHACMAVLRDRPKSVCERQMIRNLRKLAWTPELKQLREALHHANA